VTDLDREQLKRDCSDALEALHRDQRMDGIAGLADSLWTLGSPYRFHGELMHGALRDGNSNAITWHLIHVLEKLEESEGPDRDGAARGDRERRRPWRGREHLGDR
jgi:hypothetical protein